MPGGNSRMLCVPRERTPPGGIGCGADSASVCGGGRAPRAGADAAELVRQEQSVPILQVLEALLREHSGDNDTFWFRAVRYTLKLWDRLSGFTRNGRVEIDNNLVENRVRPIALGRKNYLFAGSHAAAANAATIYSLLEICQLHEVHPQEWLMEILTRVETTPDEELHTLLPHHWKATRQEEKQVPLAKAA